MGRWEDERDRDHREEGGRVGDAYTFLWTIILRVDSYYSFMDSLFANFPGAPPN